MCIKNANCYNFGVQKRLRAFLNPFFTGGVVEENGICSAAFCESAALRERLYLVFTTLSVKMRLERSAERDKRPISKEVSAIFAQSASGGHF